MDSTPLADYDPALTRTEERRRRYVVLPLVSLLSCAIAALGTNSFEPRWAMLGFGAFTVSYAWRSPFVTLASRMRLGPAGTVFLAIVCTVMVQESVRLGGLVLVVVEPEKVDYLFALIWSYAVGFTTAHEVYGNSDVIAHLALYEDDMLNFTGRSLMDLSPTTSSSEGPDAVLTRHLDDAWESPLLDRQLEFLVHARKRAQLEEQLGTPFVTIPLSLLCLQRLDSILFNMGLTILMGNLYFQHLASTPQKAPVRSITIICFLVWLSILINLAWGKMLTRWGVHVVAYGTLLVTLTTFIGGLGSWGIIS